METHLFQIKFIVSKVKHPFKLFALICLLTASACNGQKMVQKPADAKILEINKERFIGKPLNALLAEISPKIKFVYGNPDNTSRNITGGTFIKFFFIDFDTYKKKFNKDEEALGITVKFELEPSNTRKALPKEGLKEWTKEQVNDYSDMIIQRIYVSGKE